jgi:signal transduction histidine kinase
LTKHFDYLDVLRGLLSQFKQKIASAWARELISMPIVKANGDPALEIQDLASDSLEQILGYLFSSEGDTALPSLTGLLRLLGSDPASLTEALWLCRNAILPYIHAASPEQQNKLTLQLDDRLGRLIIQLAHQLSQDLHKKIKQASDRTAMMTDIVRLVGSTLDLGEVLTQAGKAIAAAAGANNNFFYLVSNDNDLLVFSPANIPWLKEMNVTPGSMARIPATYLSPIDALWQVLKEKRPVSIYDAQNAPNTTHVDELRKTGIKSFLLVPCVAKGVVVAVAVVETYDDYRDFSKEEIELAWAIAQIVAPAIENARLYQKVEQLAAIAERARLARAMHDNLAQTLGAMQLKASQTGELLHKDQIEEARINVIEMGKIAKEAYTDVREAIFNLRTKIPGGMDFISYLRDYLSTYQTCFGIKTNLHAEGDPSAGLTDDAADQIMYIIQEALTNIRKHAQASSVQIRLETVGKMLQVDVEDDGTGFDPSVVDQEQDWHHFGLQIMQERAAAAGGTLEVDSLPGRGTRVRVTVPVLDVAVRNSPLGTETE